MVTEEAGRPLLRLDGVVAGYGGLTVLHGLSFGVSAGTLTTIIGPNGAGKSTALRAIFGLLPVRQGEILLDGRPITGEPPRALLARGVAYVPQGRNLFPTLSVGHNLELGGVTLGDRRRRAGRMEAVMRRFPVLAEKAGHQASTLSGGEQKILEIGRALLLEPRLLLVDEPSIGLAPRLVGQVFDVLLGLRAAGVTVLVVEQNARSALAVADRALVVEQGRLALAGPAAELLAAPRARALFLGGDLGGSG